MTDVKQAALHRVLAAIAVLGRAETRDIATQAGMAYSTLTPKLRALEGDGLAQRITEAGTSHWQLTARGVLAAAVTSDAIDVDNTLPLDTEPSDGEDTATGLAETQKADPTDAGTEDAATAEAPVDEAGPRGAADAVQIAAVDADDADDAELADDTLLPRAEADDTSATADGVKDTEHDGTDGDHEQVAEVAGAAADHSKGESDDATASDRDTAAVPEAGDAGDSAASAAEAENATAKPRRRGGTLREAALAALRKLGPSKVGAVCKAIDEANEGTGAAKASPGAVRNALDKLTEDGLAALVAEKPATFNAL